MKTVTRRELNHSLAQVLDQVIATGEPVEVVTRGGPPVVIALKQESLYDQWLRQGLVDEVPPDLAVLDGIEPVDVGRTTEELLREVRGDR